MAKAAGLPSAFRYMPLDGNETIRLISLQPGSKDDPLQIDLTTMSLRDPTPYDALSYVWGDSAKSKEIICNVRPLLVTTNLFWALQRVRKPNEARFVWADAICINQNDVGERSSQVAMMGGIYGMARTVFLCMGGCSQEGDDMLVEATIARATVTMHIPHQTILEAQQALRADKDGWLAIRRMTQAPWFQRAWVVQEAGLARNPRVLYGDAEFGYRDFIDVLNWKNQIPGNVADSTWLIHRLWPDWSKEANGRSLNFLDFLSHSCYLQCLDPRDHIYAFLGHPCARIGPTSRPIVEPDYSKDPLHVYEDVTRELLQEYGVRVLSMVEQNEKTLQEDTPSWVLRWDSFEVLNDISGKSGDFKAASEIVPRLHFEARTLKVAGVVLDTVRLHFVIDVSAGAITFRSDNATLGLGPLIDMLTRELGHPAIATLAKVLTVCGPNHGSLLSRAVAMLAEALSRGWRGFPDLPGEHRQAVSVCWSAIAAYCKGRALVVTEQGGMALAPRITRARDKCCIFLGAPVASIVRPVAGGYKLLGEAYVHGFMQGEVMAHLETCRLKVEELILH